MFIYVKSIDLPLYKMYAKRINLGTTNAFENTIRKCN